VFCWPSDENESLLSKCLERECLPTHSNVHGPQTSRGHCSVLKRTNVPLPNYLPTSKINPHKSQRRHNIGSPAWSPSMSLTIVNLSIATSPPRLQGCANSRRVPANITSFTYPQPFQASDFGICHASQLPNNTDTSMENIACCSVLPDDILLERSTQEEYI
jgi:hypothetical protein